MKTGRTRLAAYALCAEDDALLLVRVAPGYPSAGVWTLPGGGVNFGEDPAAAALRELTEESGMTGEIDRLAFVDSITGENQPELGPDPWHGVRIVYTVRVTGGELRDEVEESTDKAEWVALAEFRSRPIEELVEVALTYLAGQTGRS
ncbi:MAG: NUDIX domain-containing protein [Chloroflexota bacterium]